VLFKTAIIIILLHVTCSRHEIAEKLLILALRKITHLEKPSMNFNEHLIIYALAYDINKKNII
jgi:hypothetical protein